MFAPSLSARTAWTDGTSVIVSGERGSLDTIPYAEFSPAAYVAPSIQSESNESWQLTSSSVEDNSGVFVGEDSQTMLDNIDNSVSMSDWGRLLFKDQFGLDWTEIVDNATTSTDAGSSESVVISLLYGLNIIALSVVALILVYSIMMGGIGTAHEGTAAGQKMHSIFTPIRSALSVGYLAPTMKGLSILQVLLLAGFAWSNSFSNYLWNGMLDYMQNNGGQLVCSLPNDTSEKIDQMAQVALQGITAQAYQVSINGMTLGGKPIATAEVISTNHYGPSYGGPQFVTEDEDLKDVRRVAVTLTKPVPAGASQSNYGFNSYGFFSISCDGENEADLIMCMAHNEALQDLLNGLVPIANQLVGSMQPGQNISAPSPAQYHSLVDDYKQAIAADYPQVVAVSEEGYQGSLDSFVEQAKTDGWMSAGSYYWTLARFNEHSNAVLDEFPEYLPMSKAERLSLPEEVQAYNDKIASFTTQTKTSEQVARDGGTAQDSALQSVRAMVNENLQGLVVNRWINYLSEGGDPISVLSGMGQAVISASTAVVTSYVVARGAISGSKALASGTISWVPGVSDVAQTATATMSAILSTLSATVYSVAGVLILTGLFLSYYLPAVPFVLWVFGLVGLVIMVLEMLFAAPIWAAAHSIPGGSDLTGSYSKQGYMLYLGVLLRAPLMLCGFFCGMLAYSSLALLIGKALKVYIASASGVHFLSPVSILAFIFLVTVIFVYLAHKTFSLITHLPEKVLSWVGSGSGSFDEAGEERRIAAVAWGGGMRVGQEFKSNFVDKNNQANLSNGDDASGHSE